MASELEARGTLHAAGAYYLITRSITPAPLWEPPELSVTATEN